MKHFFQKPGFSRKSTHSVQYGTVFQRIVFLFILGTYANITNVLSQPVAKQGFSMESDYYPGKETKDWILSMVMHPDCHHYITGGYILSEGVPNVVNNKKAIVSKIDPITKKVIWQTACNVTNEWYTSAAIEDLTIVNGIINAVGTETTQQIRHALFAQLDLNGNLISKKWLEPQGSIARANSVVNLSGGGTLVAGNINSNTTDRTSTLIKLDANGQVDQGFNYIGPVGSTATNVIEINGSYGEVKYIVIGYILVNQVFGDPDVFIAGVKLNGDIQWSKIFGEKDVDDRGTNIYVDIEHNEEKLDNCNTTGNVADCDREFGFDVIQKDGDVYFTAGFDYYSEESGWGSCSNGKERKEFDLVLGKLSIAYGQLEFVKNLGRPQGDDFNPRIIEHDGNLAILSEKVTQSSPRIADAQVYFSDYSGNAVTNEVRVGGDVDCSFGSLIDCDGNLVIAGNDNNRQDDYFFAKFSNNCQSKVQFGNIDVINNTSIGGNTTWSSSRKVKATITISSGGHLRIDNNAVVEFGASWEMLDYDEFAKTKADIKIPRIIVLDGGTLTVDNATLKGLYACDHDWMWDGIELRSGGHVNLLNNATIQDAKIGILVDTGAYNVNGNLNPTEKDGGGIVNANSSTFLNCRRCVHFAYSSALNGSSFNNTHFINDQGLKDPQYSYVYTDYSINPPQPTVLRLGTSDFVTINAVKGINFFGCQWLNSRVSFPVELKGIGIGSYDAEYGVSGACSFTDLNIGIQALTAANPASYITVSGGNQFIRNQFGIRLNGGQLHKIVSGNVFELNPLNTPHGISSNPSIFGIVNTGSTKITIKGNSFDGVNQGTPQNANKYGVLTDNTYSASFHQDNTFSKLYMGEQTQQDNRGLNLYCNTHTLFTNAWKIHGKLGDQGVCSSISSLLPADKFFLPCQNGQFNHINSLTLTPFTYWYAAGDPAQPNCNSTQVTKSNCFSTPTTTGCDFIIPDIHSGNVNAYRTQINGMDDGPNKQVIINELLRYYLHNNLLQDASDLLSSSDKVDHIFTRSQILLQQGNISGATAAVNSIPVNSDERADILVFMNTILQAKQDNTPLNGLNTQAISVLESIAEHRSLGGYAAQALLMAYYNHQYLIPLETENGLLYRSAKKEEDQRSINNEELLSVQPSPVGDECKLEWKNGTQMVNAKIQVLSFDGKLVVESTFKSGINQLKLDSRQWPKGGLIIRLMDQDKMISSVKTFKL